MRETPKKRIKIMPYIKASEWKATQDKIVRLEDRLSNATEVVAAPAQNVSGNDPFEGLKQAIADDAKEVSASDIGNALLNQICIPYKCREDAFIMETGKTVRAQPYRLTDSKFNVVSRDVLERLVSETKVDDIEWTAEEYDCDDIARKFVTRSVDLGLNSVGRVMSWSGGHAFCIAAVQDGNGVKFVFIEPQTDQFIEPGEGNYSLENALIIIA